MMTEIIFFGEPFKLALPHSISVGGGNWILHRCTKNLKRQEEELSTTWVAFLQRVKLTKWLNLLSVFGCSIFYVLIFNVDAVGGLTEILEGN